MVNIIKLRQIKDLNEDELREELNKACKENLRLRHENLKLQPVDTKWKDTKIRKLYLRLKDAKIREQEKDIKIMNQSKEIDRLIIKLWKNQFKGA